MPKIKIGTKVTVGEDTQKVRREFTNGHKFFTPMEMKALSENQIHERVAAAKFEAKLTNLYRDRNPLIGEERKTKIFIPDSEDALVMSSSSSKTSFKQVEEGGLEVTFKRKDYTVERIGCLHNRQDTINGELEFLKLKMEEKKNALGIGNNHKTKPLNIF